MLNLTRAIGISVFTLFLALPRLSAATLEEAAEAYQKGDYARSTQAYLEHAETSAPNASLFHNLGLSLDRQKDLGPAVAAYLRAAQLEPRHADFQYNLQFLLGQGEDKLSADFHESFPDNVLLGRFASEHEILYLSLALLVLSSLFISTSLLSLRYQKISLPIAVVLLLLTAYSGTSLYYQHALAPDLGAVSSPKLEAYSGPTQSVVIFELHAGAPFRIVDTSGDWVKIELSDQKRGWVKKEGVTSFGRSALIVPSNLSSKS